MCFKFYIKACCNIFLEKYSFGPVVFVEAGVPYCYSRGPYVYTLFTCPSVTNLFPRIFSFFLTVRDIKLKIFTYMCNHGDLPIITFLFFRTVSYSELKIGTWLNTKELVILTFWGQSFLNCVIHIKN